MGQKHLAHAPRCFADPKSTLPHPESTLPHPKTTCYLPSSLERSKSIKISPKTTLPDPQIALPNLLSTARSMPGHSSLLTSPDIMDSSTRPAPLSRTMSQVALPRCTTTTSPGTSRRDERAMMRPTQTKGTTHCWSRTLQQPHGSLISFSIF